MFTPNQDYVVKGLCEGKSIKNVTYRVTRVDTHWNVYARKQADRMPEGEATFIGHADELWAGEELKTVIKAFRIH